MTPNRKLRTTAIAAMVAVSTVFAGVAPAVADNTNTKANTVNSNTNGNPELPAGLTYADGSKLDMENAKVVTEDDLKTATNAIGDDIVRFGDNESVAALAEVFADYEMNPDLAKVKILGALNETEDGSLQALQTRLNEITATLKKAAQNQANAQKSVSATLDADLESKKVYQELFQYLLDSNNLSALNVLIKEVNKKDWVEKDKDGNEVKTTRSGLSPIPVASKFTETVKDENGNDKKVPSLRYPVKDAHGNDVKDAKNKVIYVTGTEAAYGVIMSIIKHRENVRDLRADRGTYNYVDRYYSQALGKLLNADVTKGLIGPYEAAQDKLLKAQDHDINVMQVYMNRARAQVLVLRIIQAKYAVAVRMIELYENDTLGEDGVKGLQTVKEAYYEALYAAHDSITSQEAKERQELKDADALAVKYFQNYLPEDRSNDYVLKDSEQLEFERLRKADAVRAYENIVRDRVWQTALEKAQLKDARYWDLSKGEVQKREAALQAEKDAAAKAKAEADAALAKVEAAAKAKADAEARAQKIAADLEAAKKKIADLEKDKGDKGDKGDNGNNNNGSEDDNKFPIVPIAIVGVILAALAALAGHFPALAAALPKV